jgi:hypothetical protein
MEIIFPADDFTVEQLRKAHPQLDFWTFRMLFAAALANGDIEIANTTHANPNVIVHYRKKPA